MLKVLLACLALGIGAALSASIWIQHALAPVSDGTQGATLLRFEVEAGDSMGQVAAALEAEGLIRDARVANWFARAEHLSSKLKIGEYELSGSQSTPEILEMLQGEAERSKTSAAALKARLSKEGRLESLKTKMLRQRSLDLVEGSANIMNK